MANIVDVYSSAYEIKSLRKYFVNMNGNTIHIAIGIEKCAVIKKK